MLNWTQTVDQLFTSTWMKRRPQATEQAFLKTPLIYWLREAGRVENQTGYTRVEIPLEYGSNENVRWIGKGGTVPIDDQELLTMAFENWKYVADSIVRFGTEDQQNRGKAKLISLIERKLNAAERSLYEEFERVFFGDGTGALEPNGLQNIISATPSVGTLHGIDRSNSDYSYFRNQVKASSGAASVYLRSDLRTLMNTCTKYSKASISDLFLITDQTSFELLEDETIEQKRIVNQKLGDTEFDNIQFKGRPVTWAPSAPAGNIYVINTNYLKLVVDEEYWMQMTDWKAIPDQVNDRVAQILCACNLVTDRPVAHGVLTGVAG